MGYLTRARRHRQFVGLPAIAQVGGAFQPPLLLRNISRRQHRPGGCFHVAEGRRDGGLVGFVQGNEMGLHIVPLQIRRDQAQGRKTTWNGRDDDLANTQFPGQFGGMHGTRAAKGDQAEFPGVMAALHRDDAQCFRHGGVDHGQNAAGRRVNADAQGRGQMFLDGGDGLIGADRQAAR